MSPNMSTKPHVPSNRDLIWRQDEETTEYKSRLPVKTFTTKTRRTPTHDQGELDDQSLRPHPKRTPTKSPLGETSRPPIGKTTRGLP